MVSIITPFKNTAVFLDEMLQSVTDQSYPHWEILLVDDHSIDASWEIVQKWATADSRIKAFRNPGNGIIPALRHGYSKSGGQFITRMDSDDRMAPKRLEAMVSDLTVHGQGHVALGLVEYFTDGLVGEGFSNYQNWLNGLTSRGANYDDLYRECVIPSPCWMVHRSDFEVCGGFNSDLYPEDYDLVFRMYQNKLKCLPSKQILHWWRDYPSRTSRTHVHYADNAFIDLKIRYFLQLHHNPDLPLIVWGAGKKGKLIASNLQKQNIQFHWVCDNPKKIGKEIYGLKMLGFEIIDRFSNSQNIIAVANPQAQMEIQSFFADRKKLPLVDYFFFC